MCENLPGDRATLNNKLDFSVNETRSYIPDIDQQELT